MRTRIFAGLQYSWEDDYGKKTDASKEADKFMRNGYKARIAKIKGGYAVYSRK